MDGKIDTVREGVEGLLEAANHNVGGMAPGVIATWCHKALAALSAIDPEAIRREAKVELIKKLTPIIDDMDCTCNGESGDSDHSYEPCGCWKHEIQDILSAEPAQDDGKPEECEYCHKVHDLRLACPEYMDSVRNWNGLSTGGKRRLEEAKE